MPQSQRVRRDDNGNVIEPPSFPHKHTFSRITSYNRGVVTLKCGCGALRLAACATRKEYEQARAELQELAAQNRRNILRAQIEHQKATLRKLRKPHQSARAK